MCGKRDGSNLSMGVFKIRPKADPQIAGTGKRFRFELKYFNQSWRSSQSSYCYSVFLGFKNEEVLK